MKKIIYLAFLSLYLAFLFGCAYTKDLGMYDENLPQEEQVTLIIPASLTVVKFNENDVRWKIGFFGKLFGTSVAINIPAGNHVMVVNYFVNRSTQYMVSTSSASGMLVNYNFLPMNTYKLVPQTFRESYRTMMRINVIEEKK